MKKFLVILLVSLLGFLGCSGSDDTTTTTSTTVGEAVPVAPFGVSEDNSTYKWTPVQGATKYSLLVHDANKIVVIEEWYTAEEAGCASEKGLCMAKPDRPFIMLGEHEFQVLACRWDEACGPWSEPLSFDPSPQLFAGSPRFTDYGDGTVYDNDKKLMWTTNASMTDRITSQEATQFCSNLGFVPRGTRGDCQSYTN